MMVEQHKHLLVHLCIQQEVVVEPELFEQMEHLVVVEQVVLE